MTRGCRKHVGEEDEAEEEVIKKKRNNRPCAVTSDLPAGDVSISTSLTNLSERESRVFLMRVRTREIKAASMTDELVID